MVTPQCQRFADTQPGGGQEPEQGDARMRARPATEGAGSTQERCDFVGGVDVRLRAAKGRPKQARRGHLGPGVFHCLMLRKQADGLQAPRPVRGGGLGR